MATPKSGAVGKYRVTARSAYLNQKQLKTYTSRNTYRVVLMNFCWLIMNQHENENSWGTVWGGSIYFHGFYLKKHCVLKGKSQERYLRALGTGRGGEKSNHCEIWPEYSPYKSLLSKEDFTRAFFIWRKVIFQNLFLSSFLVPPKKRRK